MKLSALFAVAALAVASTEACAKYKHCWCERDNFEFQGKVQDNVPWDDDTVKACADNSGEVGYYGQNFKECYRYKKNFIALIPSKAINNCDWTKSCVAAGASTGYCRDKI
ncbi:hypothetical protein CGCSCA5_v007215 [Colletotrichum siamense]|uniref:EC65 protein n=2 Tax=Colletotrichum gloeosporioides species complex TaxID=2707338 RepID=A0A9W4WFM5_9PEZI|nr:uncharacterized protein CGCA056_v014755 [Colletotrichum aenigma]XP_053041518.1 uncharacterized protein COL26b_001641 [Colletotrichum chrysophilum]KAF4815350.1 hypothetical protein CGCSCA5_v007215 [Colletotrichum siamense]KAF4830760.1 hypothetical protein CGCTS75_v005726 [Colletotrichum tropicale]KAI8208820.1 hypothetical protein K4K52_001031 [Colletotrichum sp. SAR 10_76]KAI8228498.1 hypothetical protein K4K54_002177 [Colletotrichum sp. SAR 10_86]KAI8253451.1 hypothetical protein K4K58_007